MKYDACLDESGSSGSGKNWFDPRYILRVDLIVFANGLDVDIRENQKIWAKILIVEMLLTERSENVGNIILFCLLGVGDLLWNQSVWTH